ncbi:MAG: phosphoribosylamine--glycine ligase [Deltaproteobacteria bacterium]|nr:MAG: phosphoribosylamine--glycine ligase [Deltaproteobacteria bacterium]TNF25652.1 MAG: phosphoribosylamine--glycine ligase [Deltaproteobacteria bacterium]
MNIVVIGSGGREHALAKRLISEPGVDKVSVVPGNAGMLDDNLTLVTCNIKDKTDLLNKMEQIKPDLVVFGPEQPLVDGMGEFLEEKGFIVLGASAAAAQLEGSKIFSKEFMFRNDIPTAAFETFNSYELALEGLNSWDVETSGIVIKADELAAGKGVVVTWDMKEAQKTLYDFFMNPDCPVNTKRVLFEKVLKGVELSAFALMDGNTFITLGYACDYKRLQDADKGPNTGGMGCFTPKSWPTDNTKSQIDERVFRPVVEGMKKEGHPFKGILFAGLMIDNENVNVIEFNIRFGDPEAQTLLPLLEGDLSKAFDLAARGELSGFENKLTLSNEASVHIVAASGGYPAMDGKPMNLDNPISIEQLEDATIFFAGVKEKDGKLVNSGGRVLGVTCTGETIEKAREAAYRQMEKINFDGMIYRSDIASGSDGR